MAYNGFPATYQPMYYPQQYQPQMQQQPAQQNGGGIIWVSGEAGAKAYLVAPNTTVQLWDSEAQCIYLKSADASGMPSMKILDYTIRSQTPVNAQITAPTQQAGNLSDYASKNDLQAIQTRLNDIQKQIDGLTAKKPTKKAVDDE